MKLGKTRDSRTRRKPKKIEELEALKVDFESQQDFKGYLLIKGYSNETIKTYKSDIRRFKEWSENENIEIEQIGYADILHYIQSKKTAVKQKTISVLVNSLRMYFNYLRAIERVVDNPVLRVQIKGVKRKVLYNILSKQELESLYHHFEIPSEESKDKNQNWFKTSQIVSKRNKVILGLMIYQGLGATELSRLTEKNVKLREGQLFIDGTRKSEERTLKLEAHQILDIMEYTLQVRQLILNLNNKTSNCLFVSAGESGEFRSIMSKLMQKLRKQSSKVESTKQIRTSVITYWLKMYNLREVQYMAGHRYVSSTEAYFVNDLEGLQEDINSFHPIS